MPYAVLAELRREHGVVRVEEPEQNSAGLKGPGYWLVLRHLDVVRVLRDPESVLLVAGRHTDQDPATPADLAYVRRMMLNMDPPEHSRLRRMLAESFTPRAIGRLESQIAGHAKGVVDRMLAGPRECDFAKDVAADLPLLALADILGVPSEDRWLMFDWSNRVIGWQDPDYASSAAFTGEGGSDLAAAALAVRPSPGPTVGCRPRSRAGMPDLYLYAAGLVSASVPPWRRRHVDPHGPARRCGRR